MSLDHYARKGIAYPLPLTLKGLGKERDIVRSKEVASSSYENDPVPEPSEPDTPPLSSNEFIVTLSLSNPNEAARRNSAKVTDGRLERVNSVPVFPDKTSVVTLSLRFRPAVTLTPTGNMGEDGGGKDIG